MSRPRTPSNAAEILAQASQIPAQEIDLFLALSTPPPDFPYVQLWPIRRLDHCSPEQLRGIIAYLKAYQQRHQSSAVLRQFKRLDASLSDVESTARDARQELRELLSKLTAKGLAVALGLLVVLSGCVDPVKTLVYFTKPNVTFAHAEHWDCSQEVIKPSNYREVQRCHRCTTQRPDVVTIDRHTYEMVPGSSVVVCPTSAHVEGVR